MLEIPQERRKQRGAIREEELTKYSMFVLDFSTCSKDTIEIQNSQQAGGPQFQLIKIFLEEQWALLEYSNSQTSRKDRHSSETGRRRNTNFMVSEIYETDPTRLRE